MISVYKGECAGKTPRDKVIRATSIAYNQNMYKISASWLKK